MLENAGKMLEHPVVYHLVPYDNCLFVYFGVDFLSPSPSSRKKKERKREKNAKKKSVTFKHLNIHIFS